MKAIFKVLFFPIALTLLFPQCEKEPDPDKPVNIPDHAFLNALIEEGVDTNGDRVISRGEAEKVTMLIIDDRNINDMTGIGWFTELDTLICGLNPITTIDLSECTELIYLDCNFSELTELDLTSNTLLKELCCDSIISLS